MKYTLAIALFLSLTSCANSQNKDYKDYDVCTDSVVYKGKVNHGKYYCTGNIRIREYKNGKKDTLYWSFGGGSLWGDNEYEQYKKLSERGQYIIDSLKEDGIPHFDGIQLSYEAMYMKESQKVKDYWDAQTENVVILTYKFHHTKNSSGYELLKETKLK